MQVAPVYNDIQLINFEIKRKVTFCQLTIRLSCLASVLFATLGLIFQHYEYYDSARLSFRISLVCLAPLIISLLYYCKILAKKKQYELARRPILEPVDNRHKLIIPEVTYVVQNRVVQNRVPVQNLQLKPALLEAKPRDEKREIEVPKTKEEKPTMEKIEDDQALAQNLLKNEPSKDEQLGQEKVEVKHLDDPDIVASLPLGFSSPMQSTRTSGTDTSAIIGSPSGHGSWSGIGGSPSGQGSRSGIGSPSGHGSQSGIGSLSGQETSDSTKPPPQQSYLGQLGNTVVDVKDAVFSIFYSKK